MYPPNFIQLVIDEGLLALKVLHELFLGHPACAAGLQGHAYQPVQRSGHLRSQVVNVSREEVHLEGRGEGRGWRERRAKKGRDKMEAKCKGTWQAHTIHPTLCVEQLSWENVNLHVFELGKTQSSRKVRQK